MGSAIKMKLNEAIFVLSLVPALTFGAILPPPPQYPTPSPVQAYNPDIGQTNVGGYGVNKDPYCHKVEKVIFKNKCEPYTEKTCWTNNIEECTPGNSRIVRESSKQMWKEFAL